MFLDDQILAMYDEYRQGKITLEELMDKHSLAVSEKLKADSTWKNMKRIINSLNLSVDRITKKYGYSMLKKMSYEEIRNEILKP